MNTTPNPLTSTDVLKETSIPANINTDVLENFSDTSEEYVCTRTIYHEALRHEFEEPKTWELRDIGDILNNSIVGWAVGPQHRFKKYGQQRSWKRATDANGFMTLSENSDVPFD